MWMITWGGAGIKRVAVDSEGNAIITMDNVVKVYDTVGLDPPTIWQWLSFGPSRSLRRAQWFVYVANMVIPASKSSTTTAPTITPSALS
jgi:hypothetical protein